MTAEPLDLAAIEERLSKATPGPWEAIDSNQGHPAGPEWEIYASSVASDDHTGWVAYQSEIAGEDGGIAWTGIGGRRDAELIAHAPEDLAALLAEVKRLREQEQRIRVAWDKYRDDYMVPWLLHRDMTAALGGAS